MKGSVAVVLALVIAGAALYFQSDEVAKNAASSGEFMALYSAAQAARQHRSLYNPDEGGMPARVEEPEARATGEESPSAPASDRDTPAPAPQESKSDDLVPAEERETASTDSTVEATEVPMVAAEEAQAPADAEGETSASAAPKEDAADSLTTADDGPDSMDEAPAATTTFGYPPFLALIIYPLSFISSLETAALAWYWTNVILFVIAMFLSMYTLSGKYGTGEKALFLVPLIASIPLIAWYLPVQSPLILALVLVLGGLCLYRAGLDFPAGIVSSIGLFSPLGVLFVVYYLAKRAWLAVAGLAAGAVIWFVVLPAIYFGPQTALDESRGYVAEVIAPLPAQMLSEETISAADNYCVWAMLKRNIAGIDYLGEQAAKYGQSQNVTVSESNWILIIFVSLGVIMVFLALLGIWRKLNDRELTIVGLEGAELVLAYLLLAPYTPLGAYVVAIFALFAVVYAARATDVRKFIHHVNYVALILAGQCFYLAYLSEKARLAGAAFAGVFILWVAVLSAITQFRPHIVRGRRSVLAEGPRPREDKPIDLVNVKARGDEKEEKKEKETREGKGRKGIIPMPSFAWRKEKGEGTAGVETEPKSGDATPIELLPEDKPQEDKDKDEGASDKIKLE